VAFYGVGGTGLIQSKSMRLPRGVPRRGILHRLALVALACLWLWDRAPAEQKNKKKEQETQTLQALPELPGTISGPTHRLTFHVTPLSPKGLLSAQIREALRTLFRECAGERVLQIRAFVAGSGDIRRVRDLVSEVFTERHQPLPVLCLVRAGGLPMEGAQVVLEAIAAGRKEVNAHGLAFFSATVETSESPFDSVVPLSEKSLAALGRAVKAAGVEAGDVVRVTCFLSSLENLAATRGMVEAEYHKAALDYVQTAREPLHALAACEAVGRLGADPAAPLELRNPEGAASETGRSAIALVNTAEVVLTGSQVSFGYQEQDARLAFERLGKELEQAGTASSRVAFAHYYPLSQSIAEQIRKTRAGTFDGQHPPAGTMLVFEGLSSMDAGFAVDAIAVKSKAVQ